MDSRRPYICSVFLSFKISPFFPFYAEEITLDATELNFFLLQCCPLRVQRHFHQELRRRHALIHCVCSSPLNIALFFPFYADEIYSGCDGTEFLFITVLSPPSTATFPPTAQTAAPKFLRRFSATEPSATRHTCRRFVWTLVR